jgi:XcyI restriction endonuclease
VELGKEGGKRSSQWLTVVTVTRRKWFMDALSEAVSRLDQSAIRAEAADYIPGDVQRILAAAGLRDEYVFPLPLVLREKPSLVGYYRLLLGASQKSFYRGTTGMGQFRSMEEHGTISAMQAKLVPVFCQAMSRWLAELLRQIPDISDRDVRELPPLTFGAQLQGTRIGRRAMQDVFMTIGEIVRGYTTKWEPERLNVRNASGRTVVITLGRDPDVSAREVIGQRILYKVAIEVKGGTDVSNAHNRAGEAEKSHLKAKRKGFKDFWTIISKQGLEMSKLAQESQTTTEWFDVTELLGRRGQDWEEFRAKLAGAVGIPLDD